MGKSRPPAPPSPSATAAAQTGQNVATAIANNVGGWADQTTPYGSLTRSQTGTYTMTDPNSGQTYEIPTWEITQSLTPGGQRIQDATMATQENLAGLARDQSGRLGGLLGQPVDMSGVVGRTATPEMQRMGWAPQLSGRIADAGSIGRAGTMPTVSGAVADVGDPTRGYRIADRGRVEDALYSRLEPRLERDRAALATSLQQKGITEGSTAWDRAMQNADQAATDARMQVIAAGGAEQSRMTGLFADQASFRNNAQAQAFAQAAQRRQMANNAAGQNVQSRLAGLGFDNAAQAQQFSQNAMARQMQNDATQQSYQNQLSSRGFNNSAAMDAFRANEAARAASLNEAYQARNQPLNELYGLMGGTQLQSPNFVNSPGLNMPTTDYAGIVSNNYNQRLASWQQQQAATGSMLSGLGRLGGLFFGL